MLIEAHFDICSLAPLKPWWPPILHFFDQSFSRPPTDAFHLQSFILYNTNTAFLSSSCVHVWTFSNCLRTGLVVWMMNTLTEAIYEDQTLTLLICLLSWASRTRLGWNRRANAENGILVTSFTIRDEQVLTNCCKCWKWYHAVEDFEDLDEEDIFIEETSFAIINVLYIIWIIKTQQCNTFKNITCLILMRWRLGLLMMMLFSIDDGDDDDGDDDDGDGDDDCNTCSWLGGCSCQFIPVLKVFCTWSE